MKLLTRQHKTGTISRCFRMKDVLKVMKTVNFSNHFFIVIPIFIYIYSFIIALNRDNESEHSYGDLEQEAYELISGWQTGQPLPEELQTQDTVCLILIFNLIFNFKFLMTS